MQGDLIHPALYRTLTNYDFAHTSLQTSASHAFVFQKIVQDGAWYFEPGPLINSHPEDVGEGGRVASEEEEEEEEGEELWLLV